ncbi:MAG: tRNA lysidine(34) synthetase TilS, partial [Gammaproteobacteria bacterium]
MRPDHDPIRQALLHGLAPQAALCVAFSGGRDSTVLLHALSRLRVECQFSLRAVHVNHGLQQAAADWEKHCAALASELEVAYSAVRVTVRNERGQGLEAAAREARYDALRMQLRGGETLLTAHHADDQLETVLLHLFRGSGVSGLAGIPGDAPFGPGRLCRPLLAVPGEDLAAYGNHVLLPQGLSWLTDPMNADLAYDRGYLRHAVTPVLRRRFPAAAGAVSRSAGLAAEAAGVLEELARVDARDTTADHRLALTPLRALSPARQCNLIRYLARERGWVMPPERRLRAGLDQLLGAAPGRQPVLRWCGHEIRRFREHLHLLDAGVSADDPAGRPLEWPGVAPLDLGGARGELSVRSGTGAGLATGVVADGLQVAFRRGGERVRAGADRHHRTLKYLFQSKGIVPWMRCHVPLVFARTELAAVADLWTAAWAAAGPTEIGLQIV